MWKWDSALSSWSIRWEKTKRKAGKKSIDPRVNVVIPRCCSRCGLWMVVPIDRSIDGRTTHGEGGEGRLGTRSAPICRGGCQSLSMLRDRSRVKGKKTRQGRLDWYSGTNTCTGSLEDFVLNKVQSWFPTAMVLQVWGSWQLFLRFRGAVHAVSIFDALRRSHIKMRQLSKWRIQVALVHEIGTTRTLDRDGKRASSIPLTVYFH